MAAALGFYVFADNGGAGKSKVFYSPDASLGITTVPASMGSQYVSQYDRYTKVTAPNGKAIHIVAQTLVSNEQMVRARNVLEHFLADYAGSQYGANKDAVANKIGVDHDRVVVNIENYGNTTAATIPLAMSEAFEKNRIKKGDWVMIAAFGAGYTSGSLLLKWAID